MPGNPAGTNAQPPQPSREVLPEVKTVEEMRWGPDTRLWMCGISRGDELYSIHLEILRRLADAYRDAGLKVTFRHETPYSETVRYRLQESFTQTRPEVVLFLNAYPDSFLHWIFPSGNARDWRRIPHLVWLTDDPAYSPGSEVGFSERDIVFCVDRTYVEPAKASGAWAAFYLPSATSIERRGSPKPKYSHPIVFVGSVTDLRAELSNLRPGPKEWLQKAVADTIQRQPVESFDLLDAVGQANLIAVVESICLHMNKPYLNGERAISYALYVLANTYKRVTLVKELVPMGLVVYGNVDWKSLLDEKEQSIYLGPIAYEDLPDLYASAAISLNIHSLQCPTCLNPRDFDVLMAGGFLVSDWAPDVEQGFLIEGREAVFYRSTSHLKQLVEYYLQHEKERLEMAQAGEQRVIQDHQYSNRVRESLRLLRSLSV